jgi:hypothetical protein
MQIAVKKDVRAADSRSNLAASMAAIRVKLLPQAHRYVSCSPYRVLTARLAAVQVARRRIEDRRWQNEVVSF